MVLFVLLPPLLWSAGLESSYVNLRRNVHPIGMLAVGLPLVTTFAVGVVAFELVPDLSLAAALTLGPSSRRRTRCRPRRSDAGSGCRAG